MKPLIALICFLAMHAPASAQSNPIKIGFICPFTGGSADLGNSARFGAELAIEEINVAGGYLGQPLLLVAKDDEAKPDNALRIADELINKDKVAFTVGFCNTGVAMKAIDAFQSAKHLLMIPVATGTGLTAKIPPKDSYVFRLSARDSIQAAFVVEEIRRRKLTKVAIFADKTGYGQGGLKDATAALLKIGIEPIYVAQFDVGVDTLRQQMREAKAAGAQAIISFALGAEQAVVAKSRAEERFNALLFGGWPMSWRTVFDRAGPAINGAMMPQTIIQDSGNSRRNAFILAVQRRDGGKKIRSLMAAGQSYDAVLMMFNAMLYTNGSTKGDALKAALENLKKPYFGVVATHEKPFSPDDHDAFASNMIFMGQWLNGQIEFVYPEDASRSAISRKKIAK